MILEISYELRNPGQNYDALYETIKTAPSWCHPMTSHWFISTNESAETWVNKLRRVMDDNDYIFVVDITGQDRRGWMPTSAWDWLNQNEHKRAVGY